MARLKDYCEIKTNFPNADFWLIRKGQIEHVGKPVKEFSPEYIGVKVKKTDILLPNYLYYAMLNLHMQRYWFNKGNGVLQLQHITVDDVKNIELG